MNMKRRMTYYYTVIVLSISFVLFGKAFYAYAAENKTITKGVFIDEVDVSGMTTEEAEEAVDEFVNELRKKELIIRVDENSVTTTLGDLEYSYKLNNVIEQALELGTTGNLIKRYKDLKDVPYEGITYPLAFYLDEYSVRELVSTKVSEFNKEPVNATVSINKGKLVYTDHILGK